MSVTDTTLCLCVILTFTMQSREQQCSTHINVLAAPQRTRGWIIYIRCQGLRLARHNIAPQPLFLQEEWKKEGKLPAARTTCSPVLCFTDVKSEQRKQKFRLT